MKASTSTLRWIDATVARIMATLLTVFIGSAVTFAAPPIELFSQYCATCHGDDTQEAELHVLDLVTHAQPQALAYRQWERMLRATRSEEMPPADAAQPTPQDRQIMVQWLQQELDRLAELQRDDPGEVVLSRLTKSQYRHVMRDLSGGIVTSAGRLLPEEGGAGEGFSNVGAAQGIGAAQMEKYLEAGKDALKHLRVSATGSMEWSPYPRQPVDDPQDAIKEASDAIIAWYVAQQQHWGEEHRDALTNQYGSAHAIYLEATWRRHYDKPALDIPLAPVALRKWRQLLQSADAESPFATWAQRWRALPAELTDAQIRQLCLAIVTDTTGDTAENAEEPFAPPYEISFHESRQETIDAATQDATWPFRIDLKQREELYLIVTDAGDGNRGEYAVWQKGRFLFQDGSSRPWQEVIELFGANSGRRFEWGIDGEGSATLGPDAVGARPPGTLKFPVPAEATVFEVELTLDRRRTHQASIQALILDHKPKSQSYVPGRMVFGGRKRAADQAPQENKERSRLLRLRNVAEANKTKIGLNAERNIFADWQHTPLEAILGPWPTQDAEQELSNAPYHYTVAQVRENATAEALRQLHRLETALVDLAVPPSEQILAQRAREAILPFAAQAWRRPLLPAEEARLLRLYQVAKSQHISFDSSVKSSLLAVLLAPDFLYHLPRQRASIQPAQQAAQSNVPTQVDAPRTQPLGDYQLASRLSFFLWGSLPDATLLELAAEQQLHRSDVLRKQAQRMLLDPRARSLVTDFAAQLWSFADFEHFMGPDSERFPEFTPALRTAMLDEVHSFLEDIFRNDRPLTDLIDAERATDDAGQSSDIAASVVRRGLPTMPLFLTQTSLPLRTSPVQRGVWLSERFLGREIPAPPPSVAAISEDETDDHGLPARDQLARHRASANCAACHAKFDPLGIALENFDPIGRWRATLRDGTPIQSDDTMPDGFVLSGAGGLTKYLQVHQQEVLRHFTRKLLGYALGRAVQPGDAALLARLEEQLPRHRYRLSFLIEEIVTSPQFTTCRTPDDRQPLTREK